MHSTKRLQNSLILLVAVLTAAVLAHLATISRVGPVAASPATTAALVMAGGFISPLWISPKLSNGAARQLFFVAWRLGILLPAVALSGWWDGEERKCFITVLLACYFVALPLESWLLIQEARESDT